MMNYFNALIFILIIIFIIVIAIYIVKNKQTAGIITGAFFGGVEPMMKLKRLRLDDQLLEQLREGKKKIDVRLYRPIYDQIDKGSQILYFSGEREVVACVKKKIVYENLNELLEKEKIEDIFPDEKISKKDAKTMFLVKEEGGKGHYKSEEFDNKFVSLHIKPVICED